MRRVDFSPPDVPTDPRYAFWTKYIADADAALAGMLDERAASGKPDPGKAGLWAKLKRWMLDTVFEGKCAYCQGDLTGHAPMHAEHWRPKNAVTDLSDLTDDATELAVEQGAVAHPGYWWLAYDWRNIVPACDYCNTAGAKGTKFPIGGTRAFAPEDGADPEELDRIEKPLLLHPFFGEDPSDHIGFYRDGTAYAKRGSDLGRATIKVMGLNRDGLVNKRRKRQAEAVNAFRTALGDSVLLERPLAELMADWDGPRAVYVSAVQERLAPLRQVLREQL